MTTRKIAQALGFWDALHGGESVEKCMPPEYMTKNKESAPLLSYRRDPNEGEYDETDLDIAYKAGWSGGCSYKQAFHDQGFMGTMVHRSLDVLGRIVCKHDPTITRADRIGAASVILDYALRGGEFCSGCGQKHGE